MELQEFLYDLPPHLIAQHPAEKRDHSRLMVVDRRSHSITHRVFHEIMQELRPGDALLLNNTKVLQAKLVGQKETGGRVEVLLVERLQSVSPGEEIWTCLVQHSRRIRAGTTVHFHPDLVGETLMADEGMTAIRFRARGDFLKVLGRVGRPPLPPYIRRRTDADATEDRQRYQTVFAKEEGAIAAPTAGLHFTSPLISRIRKAGVSILFVTLHIGIGTFLPVRTARIEEHPMHREAFHVRAETADTINRVKQAGGRIIAVGTTAVRAVESTVDPNGQVVAGHRTTDLFIYPPFRFRVVDVLVTNFHLPGSTLLMLVSAFAGRELILRAYEEAIGRGYRFYSYGDAMMIV